MIDTRQYVVEDGHRTSWIWNWAVVVAGCVAVAPLTATRAHALQPAKKADKKDDDQGLTLEKLFPKKGLFGPSASSTSFSSDGRYGAYLYRPYPERRHGSDLYIVDVARKQTRRVTSVAVLQEFHASSRQVYDQRVEAALQELKKKEEKQQGADKKDADKKDADKKDADKKDSHAAKLKEQAIKMVQEGWVAENDHEQEKEPRYRGVSSIDWSPVDHHLLFSSGGDIYQLDAKTGDIERLTRSRASERSVSYLPDGSGYAFVANDALRLVRFGSHIQRDVVTVSGSSTSSTGSSSTGSSERIAGYEFSPDGQQVAVKTERYGAVPNGRKVIIASYQQRFMDVREVPRQVSDDPLRPRDIYLRVHQLDEEGKEPNQVPEVFHHKYTGPRDIVSPVDWSLDSKKLVWSLYTQTTDRVFIYQAQLADIQKKAEEAPKLSPASSPDSESASKESQDKPPSSSQPPPSSDSGLATKVYEFLHTGGPTTPGMIDPRFLADNHHIVMLTEQSGFRQLMKLDPLYQAVTPVTAGKFEVYPLRLSKDRKTMYVSATREFPARQDIYAVSLDKPASESMKRLTSKTGYYSTAAVAPNGKTVLSNFVTFGILRELVLIDVAGKKQQSLTDSHAKETRPLVSAKPEFFEYPNREGHDIYGHLFKPPGWKAKGKYPLLIYVYGGPLGMRKNVVDGSYSSDGYLFARYMAEKHGFVTCTIDPRGMSGYSAVFEKANFKQVGRPQVNDLTDGVKFLIENFAVDPKRVAIHGWSFGGFQTQMCLFLEPDVFQVGMAGAGPTEWENYNKWYSTGTIGESGVGSADLKKFSLLPLAKKLKGHLLLVHGMEDSNVLYQDTVRVYRELLKAGKGPLVELFLDPTGGHGLGGDVERLDRMKKYEAFLLQHVDLQP